MDQGIRALCKKDWAVRVIFGGEEVYSSSAKDFPNDHVAHSGGTLIMLSEVDGRILSPSAVMVRHTCIEPT